MLLWIVMRLYSYAPCFWVKPRTFLKYCCKPSTLSQVILSVWTKHACVLQVFVRESRREVKSRALLSIKVHPAWTLFHTILLNWITLMTHSRSEVSESHRGIGNTRRRMYWNNALRWSSILPLGCFVFFFFLFSSSFRLNLSRWCRCLKINMIYRMILLFLPAVSLSLVWINSCVGCFSAFSHNMCPSPSYHQSEGCEILFIMCEHGGWINILLTLCILSSEMFYKRVCVWWGRQNGSKLFKIFQGNGIRLLSHRVGFYP